MQQRNNRPWVLISGAAGHAGQGIVMALHAAYRVRGFDVKSALRCDESIIGSVTDLESCRRAMSGVTAVVIAHMAPNPQSYQPPFAGIDINVRGAANLYQAAAEAGIRQVVLISSASVLSSDVPGSGLPAQVHYAPKESLYSLTKAMQELLACHYFDRWGVVTTVLRPSWIVREADGQTKYEGKIQREYSADLIDPVDLGEAVRCCLQRPSHALEAFAVGQPEYLDVAHTMQQLDWQPVHTFAALRRQSAET